jgi:hypothetical protein
MLHRSIAAGLLAALAGLAAPVPARAGDLVLKLDNGQGVTLVGAFNRWDEDGNPRKPVNPKAKIDRPDVTVTATRRGAGSWLFAGLPSGRYDLVIVKNGRVRVEGFHYPPVQEFDPFFPAAGKDPGEDSRKLILNDIAKGRHYENRVVPLALAGDGKNVRILMQLVRDRPTSYDGEAGFPVATVRHEVWQYTRRYGGWSKERATRLLGRILLPRDELRKWTWVWEARLGGIEVKGDRAVHLAYRLPDRFEAKSCRGWFPE